MTLPASPVSCQTGPLDAGTYDVTATYSGDTDYAGSSAPTSFTITQAGTAFTAQASPSTTTYGNTVVLSAAGLPADATGTVTFTAGDSTLCSSPVASGAASCTTAVLVPGTYNVTASYGGDINYLPSTASTTFSVTRAPTSFVASATPVDGVWAAAPELSGGDLPPGPGTVTFTTNGTVLCSAAVIEGAASCKAPVQPDGRYLVTATYSGNSNYLGATAGTAFVINGGYWLAASDGGVFAFGGSRFRGSTEEPNYPTTVEGKVAGMASMPDGLGYWLVTSEGQVLTFGDATSYGDLYSSGLSSSLAAPIVGIAATPDGHGYWLVGADGGLFSFGDAHFYGNIYSIGKAGSLAAPIVGMSATPDGHGYWLVGADGGLFNFGDAHFYGNIYSIGKAGSLHAPIVGMSATPDGLGYWMVGADGGLFNFGDAHFYGNAYSDGAAGHLKGSVVSVATCPEAPGYWMVTSQGEVLTFGLARADGDIFSVGLAGKLRGPIVGIVAAPYQGLP